MRLTGPQLKLIREALLDAFTRPELARVLSDELDWDLDEISTASSYADVVFELARWANAREQVPALLAAARRANPGSTALQTVAPSLDEEPAPAAPAIPWPENCLHIDAAALAEAVREAGVAGFPSMYARLGQVSLAHIAAGQDVRRDLTDGLLQAVADLGAAPGMRFALIRARGGNGKSTLLLRLAYELAELGAAVLLASEGSSPRHEALRRACAALDAATPGGRAHLLLDNAYREHGPLLAALQTLPIPNLTVIATSRYSDVLSTSPTPGSPLVAQATDLEDLNGAEEARLIEHIRACGALRAADPALRPDATEEQEPLLVAIARLTRVGGLDPYVQRRLVEMNGGEDPSGREPAAWLEFLRVYYMIAVCHAWGAGAPEALLPALAALTARRVRVLVRDPASGEFTRAAREYLRAAADGTWRTDHELIAGATVRALADPAEPGPERFTGLLEQLAPLAADAATRGPAARLAGTLLRRCADTPALLFPDAGAPDAFDTLAPILSTFTVGDQPETAAQAAVARALDEPRLAAALGRLRVAATPGDIANLYAPAYLRLSRWDDVLQVSGPIQDDPALTLSERLDIAKLRGLAYSRLKQHETALAAYDAALALSPDDPALANRGSTYYRMGRYAEALADYSRSLALRPHDAALLYNRGITYAALRRYAEAVADYTSSLALRPDDRDTLTSRGIAQANLGRFADALADYSRLLDRWPPDATTLANRGIAYANLGRYEEALADYTRSLELRRDHANTLANRGIAYANLGRYDEALADYERSLVLAPDDPDSLVNRGIAYANLGRYDEALADYNRSLALRADDPDTLTARGIAHANRGQFVEALADYTRSLALRPADAATLAARGLAQANLVHYQDALDDYTRSLALRPTDADTLTNRGAIYARLQQYDAALADYDASLTLRLDDPETLTLRAVTCAALRRYDEALTDFTHSLARRPGDAGTLYNLACLYSLRGEAAAAREHLATAIAADPQNRQVAQNDPDFAALRDDPAFRALVDLPPAPRSLS